VKKDVSNEANDFDPEKFRDETGKLMTIRRKVIPL
jgi:hypothetical protein